MPTRKELRAAYAKMLTRCAVNDRGCLIYEGAATGAGYASVRVGDTIMNGHRLAWLACKGPLRADRKVRHFECDTPRCVNIAHLRAGTHRQNMADMVNRQRQARGENTAWSKISNAQANEIRLRYLTERISQRALAAEYGIHQSCVSLIIQRRTYAA